MSNLFRLRAVPCIFGFVQSIECLVLFIKCSLTSEFLHNVDAELRSLSVAVRLRYVFPM